MRCWNCLAAVRVIPPHLFLWPECTLWVGESCLENRTQPELSVTVIAFDQGGLSRAIISTLSPRAQTGRKARKTGMTKALDQRSTILSPFLITPCWASMLITSLSYLGTVIKAGCQWKTVTWVSSAEILKRKGEMEQGSRWRVHLVFVLAMCPSLLTALYSIWNQ